MSAQNPLSRRQLLQSALVAGGLGLTGDPAFAQDLVPTPECRDGDEPTLRQMEGPFYKAQSPERADLDELGVRARRIDLSGQVLTRNCRPVPRVLVDLWHADEKGDYDNSGFRYRGHIFTDAAGGYRFRTIVPALYTGRTRHFHVKVFAAGRQLLTTQLYFPNEPMNERDSLYRRELTLRVADGGEALAARFDFILNVRQNGA